jgi:membrane fusion protein, multidrug efflux system
VSKNVRNALIVLALILAWLISGAFLKSPESADISSSNQSLDNILVEVVDIVSVLHRPVMKFNAYTEPFRSVNVSAETAGAVISTPAKEGSLVEEGELLAQLNPEERELRVRQARATLQQREIEFDAARELKAKNLLSSAEVAKAEAELESARAMLEAAELELRRSSIRAPFTGLFNQRYVEAGDFMQRGVAFGQMLQLDPLKVIFQVSEKEVLKLDSNTQIDFQTGEGPKISGQFFYRSAKANDSNRAFQVEALLDNSTGELLSDLSGTVQVYGREQMAHPVPASAMSLNAAGQLFVKAVDQNNQVEIHNINIISDEPGMVWVTGLPEVTRLIITGHEYVGEGQQVEISLKPETEIGSR